MSKPSYHTVSAAQQVKHIEIGGRNDKIKNKKQTNKNSGTTQ